MPIMQITSVSRFEEDARFQAAHAPFQGRLYSIASGMMRRRSAQLGGKVVQIDCDVAYDSSWYIYEVARMPRLD